MSEGTSVSAPRGGLILSGGSFARRFGRELSCRENEDRERSRLLVREPQISGRGDSIEPATPMSRT